MVIKGMIWALNQVLKVYKDKPKWQQVVQNVSKSRFFRDNSKKYIGLYNYIKVKKSPINLGLWGILEGGLFWQNHAPK